MQVFSLMCENRSRFRRLLVEMLEPRYQCALAVLGFDAMAVGPLSEIDSRALTDNLSDKRWLVGSTERVSASQLAPLLAHDRGLLAFTEVDPGIFELVVSRAAPANFVPSIFPDAIPNIVGQPASFNDPLLTISPQFVGLSSGSFLDSLQYRSDALMRTRMIVVDTGFSLHAELPPNTQFRSVIAPGSSPSDPTGHGTAVLSVAAGIANNNLGSLGIAPSNTDFIVYQACTAAGCSSVDSFKALTEIRSLIASDLDTPTVVLFNVVFPTANGGYSPLYDISKQALVVLPAGNAAKDLGLDQTSFPAAVSDLDAFRAVALEPDNGEVASYSNFNSRDSSFVGVVGDTMAISDAGFDVVRGTSFAAGMLAGVVNAYLSVGGSRDFQTASKAILATGASSQSSKLFDLNRLDAAALIEETQMHADLALSMDSAVDDRAAYTPGSSFRKLSAAASTYRGVDRDAFAYLSTYRVGEQSRQTIVIRDSFDSQLDVHVGLNTSVRGFKLVDFDGDQNADLVALVSNTGSDAATLRIVSGIFFRGKEFNLTSETSTFESSPILVRFDSAELQSADLNYDGRDDLLVGFGGGLWVLFGRTPDEKLIDLSSPNALSHLLIRGGSQTFGRSIALSSEHLFVADPLDDIGGTVSRIPSDALLSGSSLIDASTFPKLNPKTVVPNASNARFGASLSAIDDGASGQFVVIGAPNFDDGRGAAFVFDSESLDFESKIITPRKGANLGSELFAVDVDGNTIQDLVVSASDADPLRKNAGRSYIIPMPFSAETNVNTADSVVSIFGPAVNSEIRAYGSVDFDRDSKSEIILVSPNLRNVGGLWAKEARSGFEAITTSGTSKSDLITLSLDRIETVVARDGNDVINYPSQYDRIDSGFGDDTIAVSDLAIPFIDGGPGMDKIEFHVPGSTLALNNRIFTNLHNIETFDLHSAPDSLVIIDRQSISRISPSGSFSILRDASTDVLFADPENWVEAGLITLEDGKELTLYQSEAISLAIENTSSIGEEISLVTLFDSITEGDATSDRGQFLLRASATPTGALTIGCSVSEGLSLLPDAHSRASSLQFSLAPGQQSLLSWVYAFNDRQQLLDLDSMQCEILVTNDNRFSVGQLAFTDIERYDNDILLDIVATNLPVAYEDDTEFQVSIVRDNGSIVDRDIPFRLSLAGSAQILSDFEIDGPLQMITVNGDYYLNGVIPKGADSLDFVIRGLIDKDEENDELIGLTLLPSIDFVLASPPGILELSLLNDDTLPTSPYYVDLSVKRFVANDVSFAVDFGDSVAFVAKNEDGINQLYVDRPNSPPELVSNYSATQDLRAIVRVSPSVVAVQTSRSSFDLWDVVSNQLISSRTLPHDIVYMESFGGVLTCIDATSSLHIFKTDGSKMTVEEKVQFAESNYSALQSGIISVVGDFLFYVSDQQELRRVSLTDGATVLISASVLRFAALDSERVYLITSVQGSSVDSEARLWTATTGSTLLVPSVANCPISVVADRGLFFVKRDNPAFFDAVSVLPLINSPITNHTRSLGFGFEGVLANSFLSLSSSGPYFAYNDVSERSKLFVTNVITNETQLVRGAGISDNYRPNSYRFIDNENLVSQWYEYTSTGVALGQIFWHDLAKNETTELYRLQPNELFARDMGLFSSLDGNDSEIRFGVFDWGTGAFRMHVSSLKSSMLKTEPVSYSIDVGLYRESNTFGWHNGNLDVITHGGFEDGRGFVITPDGALYTLELASSLSEVPNVIHRAANGFLGATRNDAGVVQPIVVKPGKNELAVTIGGIDGASSHLKLWIDLNNDDLLTDDETVAEVTVDESGVIPISFLLPPNVSTGDSTLQIRIASSGINTSDSFTADGEVELYPIEIKPNEAPLIDLDLASVSEPVYTQLQNSGTVLDPEGGTVTMTASIGQIEWTADGKWTWSLQSNEQRFNQSVTLTATDPEGLSTNITFRIDSYTEVAQSYVSYPNSAYKGEADPSKELLQSGLVSQVTSAANVTSTVFGITGVTFEVIGLTNASLGPNDLVMRVSPKGAFNPDILPPSLWQSAPTPKSIRVQPSTQIAPGVIAIEWEENAIAKSWLQIILRAGAGTGLLNQAVFYIGNAPGDVDLVEPYRVTTLDVGQVRAQVSNSVVPITNNADLNKNKRVTTEDVGLVRALVSSTIVLQSLTVPPAGSTAEGEGADDSCRNDNNLLTAVDASFAQLLDSRINFLEWLKNA